MRKGTVTTTLVITALGWAGCGGTHAGSVGGSDAAVGTDGGDAAVDTGPGAEGGAAPPRWLFAEAVPARSLLVAVDASNVDLIATEPGPFDFGAGYTVPTGSVVCAARLDFHGNPSAVTGTPPRNSQSSEAFMLDLTTDPAGDFVLVGQVGESAGSSVGFDGYPCDGNDPDKTHFDHAVVDVFSPSTPAKGDTCVWQQILDPANGLDGGWNSVAVDPQGNIFLGGWGTGTVSGQSGAGNALVAKLDSTGKVLWQRGFDPTSGLQQAEAAAVDPAGDVYVFGLSSGESYTLAKYDGAGNLLWSTAIQGLVPQSLYVGSNLPPRYVNLVVDGQGNATVVGDMQGPISLDDVDSGAPASSELDAGSGTAFFVASYNASGAYRWGHVYPVTPDPNLQETYVQPKIALGVKGQVIVGGTYWATVDLGGGPLPSSGTTKGDRNVFLAAFDASGSLLWSNGYGSPHTNTLDNLAGNGAGVVAVAGTFTDAIAFGSTPLTTSTATAYLGVLSVP